MIMTTNCIRSLQVTLPSRGAGGFSASVKYNYELILPFARHNLEAG